MDLRKIKKLDSNKFNLNFKNLLRRVSISMFWQTNLSSEMLKCDNLVQSNVTWLTEHAELKLTEAPSVKGRLWNN